jgi:hypothetical protein
MYFKQFLHDETGCSSSMAASRQTREAAIVDHVTDLSEGAAGWPPVDPAAYARILAAGRPTAR